MHLIKKSKFFTTVVISMKKTRNRLLKLILKTILWIKYVVFSI